MAQETVITAKVDASGGIKSIKDLQNSVKSYRNELVNLQRGTKEYNQALQGLAQTQGRINEINRDISASTANLTNVYSTITGTLSSVAGGFTAVQGVIALTGQSGEALEQTFVKLQAALALTQGLTAFSNGIKSARLAVIAFNTAVASNPLVALTIALAAAGAALAAFVLTKKEDVEVTEQQTDAEVAYLNVLRETEDQLSRNNRLLTASGKSRSEVINSDIAFYNEQIRLLRQYWSDTQYTNTQEQNNAISDRISNYYDKIKELEFDLQVEVTSISTSEQNKRMQALRALREKELADAEAANNTRVAQEALLQNSLNTTNSLYYDRQTAIENTRAREADLASAIQFEIEENTRLQESLRALIHDPEASIEARIEATSRLQDAIMSGFTLTDEAESLRLENIVAAAEEEILIGELTLKRQQQIEKAKQDARKATLKVTQEVLSSTTKLLGEETAAGKATAIAATTINTYQAATAAYSALAGIPIVGPALGIAAAAAAVIAGAANVKKIASVDVPGGSGNSGSSSGISLPNMPEVTVPIQETHNNLNARDEEFYGSQNMQVVVSEGDISRVQNRVEVAENEARF